MLLNQRKPVYRPLRMREPGVLVNQPLTSLIQKSDTLTKSRKQLQRHLRPPYHDMLVTLIKHPTATNSMAIPFPNVSALKQALRYYSRPSPRTSLGIQTRMPLTDKYWSAYVPVLNASSFVSTTSMATETGDSASILSKVIASRDLRYPQQGISMPRP